ncbi:MAG: NADH-quinone oxidoreductase subunit L [Chloroflexaceae bacterium]|nr:NADH-quinone oxidoreductase subunit L [Chloroflexaceae bacterium]
MAFFLQLAWLIPLLPLTACVLITFVPPLRRNAPASGWLAIGLMLLASVIALGTLAAVGSGLQITADGQVTNLHSDTAHDAGHGEAFHFPPANLIQRIDWAPTGASTFQMGIYIDGLTAVLLAMVTITSTCIHLFSFGYMAGHPRQARFFSFIALFTAAMLLMSMADNLLLFFMAWEVMGLCSYLLIGFLFTRPTAYRAAVKAFIVTRIGDVLMLIGMVYLYTRTGTLAFGTQAGELFDTAMLAELAATQNMLGMSHITAIALLIFAGTIGKAAQFPLHVWLPDAMEGPTPVSALIHAATMVAAGVFLVARVYPIFTADGGAALQVVTWIGAFTALFAATIAVAQYDIKRILAYSTLSQLGFMVAALGIGGFVAGFFHLITHAFFKALLFLGSGSVIHAMEHTPAIEHIHHHNEYAAQQTAQDIRNMGGLRHVMPYTFITYLLGALALMGIPPLAGFWSKDEILADGWKYNFPVYIILSLASLLTAFYMTRQVWLVFFGEFRGANPLAYRYTPKPSGTPAVAQSVAVEQDEQPAQIIHAEHAHQPDPITYDEHSAHGHGAHEHADHSGHGALPHENGWHIVAPLVVLAFFAVFAGALNLPGSHWLADVLGQAAIDFNILVALISTGIAGLGIAAGWNLYRTAYPTAHSSDPLASAQPGLFDLLHHAYYFDRLYRLTVVTATNVAAALWDWFDTMILARIVTGIGAMTRIIGRVNFIADDAVLNDGPDAVAQGSVQVGEQVRQTETGKAQDYIALLFGAVVLLALAFLYGFR